MAEGGRPGGAGSGLPAPGRPADGGAGPAGFGWRPRGQLALPGGQREPSDADLATTALREANEELGLAADRVELLAALPVATQTTGFRIAPFLARLTGPVPWRPQEGEVAEVVEVPVADLARPEVRVEEVRAFPTWPAAGPAVAGGRPRGLGVTHRILEPLVPRLLGGEWPL